MRRGRSPSPTVGATRRRPGGWPPYRRGDPADAFKGHGSSTRFRPHRNLISRCGALSADTEISTNVQFAIWEKGLKRFEFNLAFLATPSNSVQVFFGVGEGGDWRPVRINPKLEKMLMALGLMPSADVPRR